MTRGRSGVCAVMNCWELTNVLAFELLRFSQDRVKYHASFATPADAS